MRPHDLPFRVLIAALALTVAAASSLHSQGSSDPAADAARTETIVFLRHGEKPANDEGQLTCQGLNRALALPDLLVAHYGPAQFIFAPATTKKPASKGAGVPPGTTYSYIRPLMTIEPTAIRLGLPVETRFAFDEIGGLQSELTAPIYQRAVVYVAWEHAALDQLVKRLMTSFGKDASAVPDWPSDDFDSLFVVRIHSEGGKRDVTFAHDHQELNGLSTDCPTAKKK